jgi:galactokinase
LPQSRSCANRYRRARHVVTENARVLAAVEALREADAPRLGELLDASHESLRHDFQVSVDAVDSLVEIARSDEDVYGARMTGGGFGGSVVMLTRPGCARPAASRIAHAYAQRCGNTPTVVVPDAKRQAP